MLLTAVPPFSKLEIQRFEIGEPIYLYVEIVRRYSTSCKGRIKPVFREKHENYWFKIREFK